MNSLLTIKRAAPEDARSLTNLSVTTFRDAFTVGNSSENMEKYIDEEMSLEKLTAELVDDDNIFFMVWCNNLPIGYAKLRATNTPLELESKNAIELERLYVLQEYQSMGFGKSIIDHCINYALGYNYELMWLGVWEHNHRARKFYQTQGFELFGAHIFMLGNDPQRDVLMKKRLKLAEPVKISEIL